MRLRRLRINDLIMPYFVVGGKNKRREIKSMPGIFHLSIDNLLRDIAEVRESGIKAILLFGLPGRKDALGSEAYSEKGAVQQAIRAISREIEDIAIITDVCLCGYTSHGHCGILEAQSAKRKAKNKVNIDNKKTLEVLSSIALSHAQAGADWVAPSAMAKGQVGAIRGALDKNGYNKVRIMGYSAKFASNFYGPFREAANSAPAFGDRKGYQLDYNDAGTAIKKIEDDIREGADVVMVKPALAYLDVIYLAKQKFNIPIAAYSVSGEYAMVRKYSAEKDLILEILTGIKRSGADLIITYWAKDAAKWLK